MSSPDVEAPALDLPSLQRAYRSGQLATTDLADAVLRGLEREGTDGIWIHRASRDEVMAQVAALERRRRAGEDLPLYGVPFAVKDNIDVTGWPTTAACPAYRYVAERSAPVVDRLIAAGALLFGKTNLDQLATGLVGVRSPLGVPTNPFDARYVVGGSSSGSAAAVTRGLVSFALGTDTAGSGRIPAAFTNIVGLKPSRGLLSTTGVVPACRSLDCVSVFALTVDDAAVVADVAVAFDPDDPRAAPAARGFRFTGADVPAQFRFGVPDQLQVDSSAQRLFDQAVERLRAIGGEPVTIPFDLFHETGRLLYEGPWIAERLADFEPLLNQEGALLPVIRELIGGARRFTAAELFRAQHRLAELRRDVARVWERIDLLVVPSAPTIPTIDEVTANPIGANAQLGRYTNFVNLLDLAALAVPGGLRDDGLPGGITLVGPREADAALVAVGVQLQRRLAGTLGATGRVWPPRDGAAPPPADVLKLAVVGAHLSGMPLNHQLTDLGGKLVRACKTAPRYRLFELPDSDPPKPGLVRALDRGGLAIEVEVWSLPRATLGTFFANVRAPLCLGTVELDDGERVTGFLCEAYATGGAKEISGFGGWRRYLASKA